ncbi:MAG: hypothetical protein Q9209_006109 [Squamulea sp. 1 TL-2023]
MAVAVDRLNIAGGGVSVTYNLTHQFPISQSTKTVGYHRWLLATVPASRRHLDLLPPKIQHKIQHQVSQFPSIKVHYKDPPPRYNGTKIVLLIEERPIKHLTPLLLHIIFAVPPEWQLLYLGSAESLAQVNRSINIQHYQMDGKLKLKIVPRNASYEAVEQRNRMLTDITFYKEYVPKAEWLLMHHADSILCTNSPLDLNDWLKYDWVGAPWYNYGRWNGGGGLSLRRVSRIQQVLSFQSRQDDQDSEDRWLSDRIKLLPGIKLPKYEVEKTFAVEGVWDESPMGFHIPSSNDALLRDTWDNPARRKRIFEYCPDIKIILDMKLERERCQEAEEQSEFDKEAEAAKQAEAEKLKEAERLAEEEKKADMKEQTEAEEEKKVAVTEN